MQNIILKIENEDFEVDKYTNIECFAFGCQHSFDFLVKAIADIKKRNKIALIYGENSAKLCRQLDADGAIIDLSSSEHIKKDFEEAKKDAGKYKTFGVICRSRRHETMLIAECEPDFIIFKVGNELTEKQKELFDWYQEFFLIQDAANLVGEDLCKEHLNVDILMINEKKYKILVAMKRILE